MKKKKSKVEFNIGDLVIWRKDLYFDVEMDSFFVDILRKKNKELGDKWTGLVVGYVYSETGEILQLKVLGKCMASPWPGGTKKLSNDIGATLDVNIIHPSNLKLLV